MSVKLKINKKLRQVGFNNNEFGTRHDLIEAAAPFLQESVKVGGLKEYFDGKSMHDIDEVCRRPGSKMSSDEMAARVVLMMEASKEAINEDTNSAAVGGFIAHLLPVIRVMIPQNPVLQWVSVQNMTKKIGTLFYQNFNVSKTKGRARKGDKLFDPFTGYSGSTDYTSEFVDGETLSTATTAMASTLAYAAANDIGGGVKPNSVSLVFVDLTDGISELWLRDDGNGNLVKDVQQSTSSNTVASGGTINYTTGAIAGTLTSSAVSGATAYYEYDSEGSSNIPSMTMNIVSEPIQAKMRALSYRYSIQSQQDYNAEFGISIDEETVRMAAALLTAEQARDVLRDLWLGAGAAYTSFSTTPPSAYITRREHYGDLQWPLAQTQNQMFRETQRAMPNFMVVDSAFNAVLQTLGAPHFMGYDGSTNNANEMGIKYVGTWNDGSPKQVYLDPLMQDFEGASPMGNALLGFRGDDFRNAGYAWCVYQPLFRTTPLQTADFVTQGAMGSRIGKKMINRRFYKRIELTA